MTETLVTELKSHEARKALAEAVLALLKQWDLHEVNQIEILGVDEISTLKQGAPLPDDEEILERAGNLLAIERALKKLYPLQISKQNDWIFIGNPLLDDVPPINLLLEGRTGIKKVRELIESQLKQSSDKPVFH